MRQNKQRINKERLSASGYYGLLDLTHRSAYNDIGRNSSVTCKAKNANTIAHDSYADMPIRTARCRRTDILGDLYIQGNSLPKDRDTILPMLAHYAIMELELKHALEEERSLRRDVDRFLKEKEELLSRNDILMREIDHRVKNSLQLVVGMLGLQTRRIIDNDAAQIILEAQQRIIGIMAMHEQLYNTSDMERVDLRKFLDGLCESLAKNKPNNVEALIVDIEPTAINSKSAMQIGMLTSELVINAFKYAYPEGRRGKIRVCPRQSKGRIALWWKTTALVFQRILASTLVMGLACVLSDPLLTRWVERSDWLGGREPHS